ncbi:MAG: helix-turn-helix domain-containing protein [Clostridiales bacterium]|nr:helix-turn-helix domain-containing protein [Clostridiales bacterium]
MKITIGQNIKRLRTEKGITQEQLAEAMNVSCAAVSKWERSETYPDITVLQPLAFFFGVTLDELMGYDKERVNEEIENTIAEYRKNYDSRIIAKAYKDYPNDYRIMYFYMWSLGVDDAEPDLQIARKRKDEISSICEKILEGCTDVSLCLGAWKMKAILLHAEGKTDEALKLHAEKFGDWYFSTGQMNEQLFTKDRPEFLYWAKRNMFELVEYAADKLVKSYFFDPDFSYDEMVTQIEKIGDGLYKLGCETNSAYLILQAKQIFGRLSNDLIARDYRGGKIEDIIRITDKYLSTVSKLSEIAKVDTPLFDACIKRTGTDDLLAYTTSCTLSWRNPNNVKMLENKEYREVIEKYRIR